jgi:TetR/AcrR family transcriptional regulator, transcriptional repressor of bet genes
MDDRHLVPPDLVPTKPRAEFVPSAARRMTVSVTVAIVQRQFTAIIDWLSNIKRVSWETPETPMPKLGMEPIRRRQLIEATIAAIHENGFPDATLQRISALAGVSTGIVHHYFHSKADLLEATMRQLATDVRAGTVDRLRHAKTPRDRVAAVIDGNLANNMLSPQGVTAWLAFCSQVHCNPSFRRVQQILIDRMHTNLAHALADLLPRDQADAIAEGLSILIDGLWLRAALSGGRFTPETARRIAHDCFAARLAQAQLN